MSCMYLTFSIVHFESSMDQLCDTHGINQSSTFAGIFRLSLRYHYINIYITYIYYITFTLGIYIKKILQVPADSVPDIS